MENVAIPRRGIDSKRIKIFLLDHIIELCLIALIIILTFTANGFMTWANWMNILRANSLKGVIAFGMTMVIISGMIDLSIGATVGLAGVIVAVACRDLTGYGIDLNVACIIGILICIGQAFSTGFLHGFFQHRTGIGPLIVTLTSLYILQGLAGRISGGFPIPNQYPQWYDQLGGGRIVVDRQAAGVVEAKAEGTTLSGVAEQASDYAIGLPANIPHVTLPLPFLYESTGVETFFRDERDPQPRSRRIFAFHRPETLAEWLSQPDTLRSRLRGMAENAPLITAHLWPTQEEAITNLERSFAADRPRALIQMATGSGKTFTAFNFVYRLVKFGKARRVLFLVDRNNLGRQTFKEFDQFVTPDDGRKSASCPTSSTCSRTPWTKTL